MALAFVLAALLQDPALVEVRFHRVHLRNGNFVDGTLVRQTKDELVLRIKGGEVGVRADLVERVEYVKIRGVKEKPDEVALAPKPKPAVDAPDPFAAAPAQPPADVIPTPRVSDKPLDNLYEAKGDLREKVDPLLRDLDAADVEQKATIVPRLVEVGGEAAPYLASLLEKLDPEALYHVAGALATLKEPRAVPVLIRLLESGKPAVRARAAAILGATGDVAAAPRVLPLLKDERPEVRMAALEALRALSEPGLLPHLPLLCGDAHRDLRKAAIALYLELSRKLGADAGIVAGLSRALEHGDEAASADLLGAIASAGTSEVAPLLAPYLLVDRPDVRVAAAAALAAVGGEEAARAIVLRIPSEKEKKVRLELARAAQKLAAVRAGGPLIEWIGHADIEIHTAALRALSALAGESYGADRARWVEWWVKAKPAD
ncbi:MAG TPA: HEAT repeat domain-containing protein [Planctomycetota bacterium]